MYDIKDVIISLIDLGIYKYIPFTVLHSNKGGVWQ